MSITLKLEPLTCAEFAPFGDVLEVAGDPDKVINAGMCGRYHDRANIECDGGGAGISLFKSQARSLPITGFVCIKVRNPPQDFATFVACQNALAVAV